MTHPELLSSVRQLYVEARKEKFPIRNVSRCTSHSISSELEDLIAQYCYELINDSSVYIFIDPQISFLDLSLKNSTRNRPLQYRPDILIVKNFEVRVVIDVKTDFGYNRRNYLNLMREKSSLVARIAGQPFSFKNGSREKIKGSFVFSSCLRLAYIVASNRIAKTLEIDTLAINQMSNVDVFFISSGCHLNSYNNDTNFRIDEESMRCFDKYLVEVV